MPLKASSRPLSLSQAQRMRELDQKGVLNGDVIDGIMMEDKKEVRQSDFNWCRTGQILREGKPPEGNRKTRLSSCWMTGRASRRKWPSRRKRPPSRKSNASSGQLGPRRQGSASAPHPGAQRILNIPRRRFPGSISGKISQGPKPPWAVPKAPLTDFSRLCFRRQATGIYIPLSRSPSYGKGRRVGPSVWLF